jgi:hypothetical protein
MTKKLIWALVAVFAALCIAYAPTARAQGQGPTTGALAGTVVDASGATVPDATVTITGPLGTATKSTAADGKFNFPNLVPGNYSVKVEKQGFATFAIPAVEVLINSTATVRAALQTGAVSTTLEVTSSAITVDPTESSINSSLSDSFYNSIPVARNVSAIAYLAPGVVTGLNTAIALGQVGTVQGSPASDANPSINGASGLENLYIADGVVMNDPSYGGFGGYSEIYGALGVGITPAFVKEEQVKEAGFEPKYGHATGGVIQIVTKSGTTKFHGKVGGYFASPGMQDTFANKDDFKPTNFDGRHLTNGTYEGDFELGGYVPFLGLNNKLFFFGAFNPVFFNDHEAPVVGSGLYTIYNGMVNRRTNTYSYAGKLTYRFNDNVMAESSVFGDPSHTTHSPFSTLNSDNLSGNSKWDYGTRNLDARVYATITPSWTADFAWTYSWNHFTESNADPTIYPITDQTQSAGLPGQRGQFTAQGNGNGLTHNYKAHGQSLTFDTSKIFNFAGSHTFSVGYFWQYPTYDSILSYSTPNYAIPATNATGGTNTGTASAAGQISDASLELQIAPGTCTLCPLMNVPGYASPQPVVLYQVRGRFDGGISHTTGKYHAAYVNDAWQMGQHVTLNAGLRWEQQRLVGAAGQAFFNDQWSPRLGFIVSPNPESKIYVDFDRLAYVLPLDMSVRSLSAEKDNLNEYWAPASDASGMVTLNQYGTVNFVPDAAHLLNNAAGGILKSVSISIQSGGEPFVPGTRFEYNDEFVVGAEHKFRGGFFVSARYIDRRMKRVLEDQVGQSVEQLTALAYNGGSYDYVIGNPGSKETIFVTPNEVTWQPTESQRAAYYASGNFADLVPPAGCYDANNVLTPYISGPMYNTFQGAQFGAAGTSAAQGAVPSVGTACFPVVNGLLNGDPNALYGGEYFPKNCPTDPGGRSYCKPGLYPDAQRNYQAVEFEVNKIFSNNWQLRSNFRIGRLVGNYEGAFRNDNGQADPGLSSLYDLTNGELGLLNYQLGIGPLNTDRKYVLNVMPSYTIPNGFAKNLTLGAAVRVESGIPWSTLTAQQIYGNPGEVPINGRGDLGRSPVTGTVDAHLGYLWKFTEEKNLSLSFDAFNLADTKRTVSTTQQADLAFGVLNQDFTNHIPLSFVAPFSARFGVAFSF